MSTETMTLAGAVMQARGVAFDGCHKVYVLLDDEQMTQMEESGYGSGDGSQLLAISDFTNAAAMLAKVQEWYADSCGLRFISAVRTVEGDPNDGFITIVGQFEDES